MTKIIIVYFNDIEAGDKASLAIINSRYLVFVTDTYLKEC